MVLTDDNAQKLQIIVDASRINSSAVINTVETDDAIYCHCKGEFCQCGSSLGVTEGAAKLIYLHIGFADGRDTLLAEGYRLDTVHVWGTHDLSTEDLLKWVEEYNPLGIEWIDDSSCNIVFASENMALRMLSKHAEPFDRRIALAAMAAVVSTMDTSTAESVCEPSAIEPKPDLPLAKPSAESLLPPSGRWFKSTTSPSRTFCLFVRIAHKSDVKLPGAERRSDYYRRHGNPNFGGIPGVLSRSYRRRAKVTGPACDVRTVNPNERRELMTYEDMDEDIHGLANRLAKGGQITSDEDGYHGAPRRLLPSGRRREAGVSGLAQPPRNPPPKWPRRQVFPGHVICTAIQPETFHPSLGQPSFDFQSNTIAQSTRVSAKKRLGFRSSGGGGGGGGAGGGGSNDDAPVARVTILPDAFGDEEYESVHMLTSMKMVADVEEAEANQRRQRSNMQTDNIFNSRGPSGQRTSQNRQRRRGRQGNNHCGSQRGDVWDRLG